MERSVLSELIGDNMPGNVLSRARRLFVLATLLTCGCGSGPSVEPVDTTMMPELEATAAELVEGIDARADSVEGIVADLDIVFKTSSDEPLRLYGGMLVSLRAKGPGGGAKVYLEGYSDLETPFFTMTSDGTGAWTHFPGENKVYIGPYDRSGQAAPEGIDLDAADLAKALYVEPFQPEDIAGLFNPPD